MSGGTSGEELERRYRGLLRILPKPYREARGEELLSALMDGAAPDRRWPELSEALSLARLGFRVRMGGEAGGVLVDPRAGATARAIAVAGTVLLTLTGVVQLAIIMNTISHGPDAQWSWRHPFTVRFMDHPYSIGYSVVPACWLVVLALLTAGWWRGARVLAAVLFVLSVGQTSGTMTAVQEEPLLAAVVAVALFAVRGVHARPARVAGAAGVAAAAALGLWVFEGLGQFGEAGRLMLRVFLGLQSWGMTQDRHEVLAATVVVTVVAIAAYRSVVWPVALSAVTVAVLGPLLVRGAAHRSVYGSDLVPLTVLSFVLLAVGGLAVARERRSARREQPTPAS